MNLFQAFKKPIYREDLMPVIRQGIFMSIIAGVLVGAISLLLEESFGVNLSLIYNIAIAFYISKRIKESYQNYHILYSIIAVISFVLAFYIASITNFIGFFFIREIDLLTLEGILFIMKPSFTFYFLNPFSGYFFQLEVLLDFIFFIIGAAYAFLRSK